MALSVFMHSSKRLPALSSSVSKLLLTPQLKTNPLIITPIIAKNFTGFNRQIEETKKYNNVATTQNRNSGMVSHSALWTAERVVSVALLGVIPGCLMIGGTACDNILAATVTLHMHWGIESVFSDYIRESVFGSVIPKIASVFVWILSAFTLGGLMYFNYNDIGVSRAIKRIWAIKPNAGEK